MIVLYAVRSSHLTNIINFEKFQYIPEVSIKMPLDDLNPATSWSPRENFSIF